MKRILFFILLFFTYSFGFAQNDIKSGSDSAKENSSFIPKPARISDSTSVTVYKIQNDTSAIPELKRIEIYNTTNKEKVQYNKSIKEEPKLLRVDIKFPEGSEKTYNIQDSTSVKK